MKVDLDKLKETLDYLAEINKADLADIVWLVDGKELLATPKQIIQWQYIGLNNVLFAENHFAVFE